MIKKNNKKILDEKERLMRSLHIFLFYQQYYWDHITFTKRCYRYADVSDSTQKHPDAQMLGAFCSITGGQRDFFWFPKFSKKNKTKTNQPFLNTPEFFEWITDLQNSTQFHLNWANFKTITSLVQTGGDISLCTYCCSQSFWTQSPHQKQQKR